MGTTQLSYESKRIIIYYLDPDNRFKLYRHCPSLRTIERNVPLRLKMLRLFTLQTWINDTTYSLCLRERAREVRSAVYDKIVPTTPETEPLEYGDVHFKPKYYEDEDDHSYEDNENLNNETSEEDSNDSESDEEESESESEEEENSDSEISDEELDDSKEDEDRNKDDDEKTADKKLDDSKQDDCGSDEKPNVPPRDLYIELKIYSPKGTTIERFENTMPLHEAMRRLNSWFFGGRNGNIHIKDFSFARNTVIRLPSDFKFVAKEVDVQDASISALENILQESSYPLAVFETSGKRDLEHRAARTATKLVINVHLRGPQWLATMLSLTNESVCVQKFNGNVGIDRYISIVDHWLENPPAVGTRIDFHLNDIIEKLYSRLSKHHAVFKKGEQSLKFQLNNTNVLIVSYVKRNLSARMAVLYALHYIMTFEICPK